MGLACLLAPAISEYSGIRRKSERGFDWMALGGVMFLLVGAFETVTFWDASGFASTAVRASQIFQIIGWVFILMGSLVVTARYFRR